MIPFLSASPRVPKAIPLSVKGEKVTAIGVPPITSINNLMVSPDLEWVGSGFPIEVNTNDQVRVFQIPDIRRLGKHKVWIGKCGSKVLNTGVFYLLEWKRKGV